MALVVQVAPESWPALPLPELSAVVDPTPSSRAYAALRVTLDGCTVKAAVAVLPFSAAVIVTDWLAVTGPAVAVKFAVVAPTDTVTEAGVVRAVLLRESATTEPPVGAARDRVTVQVELDPETTLVGLQASEETKAEATRLMVVLAELPLYLAVIVTLLLLLKAAVVALKLAEVAAAPTVTDAGIVRVELVSDRVTTAPADGAALVRVTVQVLEELGPMLVGLQASEETETGTGATRLTVVLAELPL